MQEIREILMTTLTKAELKKPFTVGFTGPRAFKLFGGNEEGTSCIRLKTALDFSVRFLYDFGCRQFISGMATGVDTFGAEAVLRLRQEKSNVRLLAAVANPKQTEGWKDADKRRFLAILKESDDEICVGEVGINSYRKRNLYIVQHSDIILAFPSGLRGGTSQTINFAHTYNVPVISICLSHFE